MSKVFEALRKLEKDSNGLSDGFSSEAQAIFEAPSVRAAEPRPAEPVNHVPKNGTNGTSAPAAVAEELHTEVPSGYRALPVRVSIDSPMLPFMPSEQTHQKAAEQYRIIRTKVVQHPRSPKVLVVSSVTSGDGKTVSSVNLAAVLALKSDVSVLLIDGDLRRGKIAELLGFPKTPGLTDVLTGNSSPQEAIIRAEQFPNLHVLTTGTSLTNPTELLDSPRWRGFIQQCRKQFHYVVVDTPPIGSLADYDLIQSVSDGVLLVARMDYTNRSRCLKTIASIPPDRLVGVVLNCVEDWFLAKNTSYYGYYGPEPKGGGRPPVPSR